MEPLTREQVLAALTPAEQAVTHLVVQGCSNKEIAHQRGSSESTVKHQLVSVFRKLGVESRTQLVIQMMRLGFTDTSKHS